MVELLVIVGIAAVAGIVWYVLRSRGEKQIHRIMDKHKADAQLVSRAEFVEGRNRMPVALALKNRSIFYENPDLEAQLELERIEEVEYSDELATGMDVSGRVLRLRSHGHSFEFVLEPREAEQWSSVLPSHRLDEPGGVQVRAS